MIKKENCVIWIQTLYHCIQKNRGFKDIAEDLEARFDTSNYDLNRLLLKVKNKKITCGMNVELGGKIMKEFVKLRAKACSYLIDDGCEDKRIF